MLSRMILLSMILWSGRSAAQTTTFDRIQLGALPPGAAVIGHFNGDGRPDVAVVQADKVLTFIGNGDGGFQEPLVTKISTGACGGRAGDFDGDGRTDLALSDKAYCIPVSMEKFPFSSRTETELSGNFLTESRMLPLIT